MVIGKEIYLTLLKKGFGKMSNANQTQIAGNHYQRQQIQCWDYIAANGIGYFEGNIIKYVSRWRHKGGVDDLRKAKHYIEKLIEDQTSVSPHGY